MKKSIRQKWERLVREGSEHQQMAAFFWNSDTTSDEDKYWLNKHLESFENMINQKEEYNEIQTDMAIIHMSLCIDAVQMYASAHPDLKREYDYSTHKNEGYREWIKCYILSDPATELHIIQDRKTMKKLIKLNHQSDRVRG